jgi:hypothetical protein
MGNVAKFASDNPYLIAGIAAGVATGGITTAATATTAASTSYATALSYGLAGATIQAQAHVGKQAEIDAKIANEEETFAAKDREIARRKRLLQTVAAQNVSAAAGGIEAYTGSSANIMEVSRREARGERLSDVAMTTARKRSRTGIARGARTSARISAGTTLIGAYERGTRRG